MTTPDQTMQARGLRGAKTALIDTIISMYHTTRFKDTPAADHILSKHCVQEAFEKLTALANQEARSAGGSSGPSKEWCLKMAELEGDAEIGAGALDHPLRIDPQVKALLDDVPTNWDIQGYKSPGEEIADMANVGRAFMDRIAASVGNGPLKGWSPMDCPSEIITDLLNMLEEATTAHRGEG